MKFKAFTVIEIIFVFVLILIVSGLVIPLVIDDSKTVQDVSKWRHTYSDMTFALQSMGLNNNVEYNNFILNHISNAKNQKDIEKILVEEFKPYFRIEDVYSSKRYRPRYMNSEKVKEGQYYYFENVYSTQNGQLIGLKWLKNLYDSAPFVAVMVDTNGEKAPNVWGKDIFGMNIYKDKIEPFGQNLSMPEIDMDCSKKGRGVYCSYKYLIDAQF